jgi:hypothetical protein
MFDMFKGATIFKQNLNDWDVGAVTSMAGMFENAAAFNAPLNAWNVAVVEDANRMFANAGAFNQGLGAWDVGTNNFANVAGVAANYGLVETTKITDMFKGATAMSDCNKKAIHNKYEAAPRSLNRDFNDPAHDATGDGSNWEFPNLAC